MIRWLYLVAIFTATVVLPRAAAQTDDPVSNGRKRSEWLESLKSKDAQARVQSVMCLGEMRWFAGPSGPALAAALDVDTDAEVRREAADALGKITDSGVAVPALISALKDANIAVRAQAARALGEHGPKAAEAMPVLTKRLKDQSAVDVVTAAIGLTRIDPTRDDGIRALIALTRNSKDEEAQSFALAGLAIELNKPDLLSRHAAIVVPALVALLKDDGGPGEDKTWSRRMTAATGLAILGPAAKDANNALTAALADRNKFVRMEAIRALLRSEATNAKAIQTLIAELKEQDPQSTDRFNVMNAVTLAGEIGPAAKTAVPELIALLEPGKKIHLQVQEMARHALGRIGPAAKAALPHLTPDLKAEDRTHRFKVARAVIQIDPTNAAALKIIKEVALEPKDPDWIDMRMEALFVLTTVPTERAAAIRTATAAVRAPNEFEKRQDLRIGGQVAVTRENLLLFVQTGSAGILGMCGADAKDAVRTLVTALKDPEVAVRVEAVRALEKIDPEALKVAGVK